MVKNKILFITNKIYELTNEGHVILNDHIYYYSRIIIRFFRKYTKKTKIIHIKRNTIRTTKIKNISNK